MTDFLIFPVKVGTPRQESEETGIEGISSSSVVLVVVPFVDDEVDEEVEVVVGDPKEEGGVYDPGSWHPHQRQRHGRSCNGAFLFPQRTQERSFIPTAHTFDSLFSREALLLFL
jgi:hypothetical protein